MDCQYTFLFQEACPPPRPGTLAPNHPPASHTRRASNVDSFRAVQEPSRKYPPRKLASVSPPRAAHPALCILIKKRLRKSNSRPNKKTKEGVIAELRELRKEIARWSLTPERAVYLRDCMEDMREILNGSRDDESDYEGVYQVGYEGHSMHEQEGD
jgi:hypothetical protein